MAQFQQFHPDEIDVGRRHRAIRDDALPALRESMQRLGLQTPITVRIVEDERGEVPVLVAGRHRLEAAKQLGWESIQCAIYYGDETDARLWEIAENLHRSDLNEAEKREHIAEWVKLTEEKISPHDAAKRGRPEQSTAKAARELGLSKDTVARAVAAESLTDVAKAAADAAGLGTVKRAQIARAAPDDQVRRVQEVSRVKPAPAIMNEFETEEAWRGALNRVWNRGSREWRERWMETTDRPVFDSTRAA